MSYATGLWCKRCEFFEEHIEFSGEGQSCESCGCSEHSHVHAKVVDL